MREGSKLIFLVLIAILILFSFLLSEKVQIFPPEQHKVIVRLILIDVIVIDKNGNFVTDLTKEDFEVYEDGQLRPIHSVELITLKSKEALLKKLPSKKLEREIKARKRLYVVFDCINTDYITLRRAKEKIINTLSNFLKEGFEIKIIEVNYRLGIRPLNDFTSDINIVKDIVLKVGQNFLLFEKKSYMKQKERITRNNLNLIQKLDKSIKMQNIIDSKTEKIIESDLFYENELWGRNLLQKSISYLLQIIGMARKARGRKSILLISGGFPVVGWRTLVRIFDPFNIIQKSILQNYIEIMDEIIRYANTNRISFYCIDLSGVESTGLSNYALIHLAEDTGGAYFKGTKKFVKSEEVIKRDLSYYYEIAYIPAREREDGKFHKVTVKVKKKGLRVKFREGYTDYTEEDIKKRNLAAAFFAPSFYRDIKFTCTIITLPQSRKNFRFWIRLNLPLNQFKKKSVVPENIAFLFGIKEREEEKVHLGETRINIKKAITEGASYYFGYFGTSGIKIKPGEYEACVVLTYKKENIGAWRGWVKIPDLREEKNSRIINFLIGNLINNRTGGLPFTISRDDGSLILRKYKFIPYWEEKIKKGKNLATFIQIFVPDKKLINEPEFYISNNSNRMKILSRLIEKNYNRKTRCYSYIYLLQIEKFPPGNYTLTIRIADQSSKEMEEKSIKIKIGT